MRSAAEKVWRAIPGYQSPNLVYYASEDGEIASCRIGESTMHILRQRKKLISPEYPNGRYRAIFVRVGTQSVEVYIHQLVLRALVGPCPSHHEAEHLDGDGTNNAVSNLRWSPQRFNRLRMSNRTRKPDWSDQL